MLFCSCSKIPVNTLITAFLIRLSMIFFGSRILDKSIYDLKYTDIDYNIFTDAAQLVVSGQSPYERSTYRYPPLLAIIMTPNIFLLPEFGKLLFALADVGVVFLIDAVRRKIDNIKNKNNENTCFDCGLILQNCSDDNNDKKCSNDTIHYDGDHSVSSNSDTIDNIKNINIYVNDNDSNTSDVKNSIKSTSKTSSTAAKNTYVNSDNNNNNISDIKTSIKKDKTSSTAAWLWALNPLAINICTRGSADSLTNCLILMLVLIFLQQGIIICIHTHMHIYMIMLMMVVMILMIYMVCTCAA